MNRVLDCVVCNSCTVDVFVKPFDLSRPFGIEKTRHVDRIEMAAGGLVSNAGITMARLGLEVAAFSFTGDDECAAIIRRTYQVEGIDTRFLMVHPSVPTSTTVVLVDEKGNRSFVNSLGSPLELSAVDFFENLDLFARSRTMLIGYYSLMPHLENDLPEILRRVRMTGCKTALDSAGDGGPIEPLCWILPHLDLYVPSYAEGALQTGYTDPRDIINCLRESGAPGLLGLKLGEHGALLSPRDGVYITIEPIRPPGRVIDTTGAGDCFLAGLIAGLLRGMAIEHAGRLAAAAGATCVTAIGGWTAARAFAATEQLAIGN